MQKCPTCGGKELDRIDNFRQPHAKVKGKHECGTQCNQAGWLCRRCRMAYIEPWSLPRD